MPRAIISGQAKSDLRDAWEHISDSNITIHGARDLDQIFGRKH